jgi:peptide-methionine (R)-S-oxide reductase
MNRVRSKLSATVLTPSLTRDLGDKTFSQRLTPTQYKVLREARTEPSRITVSRGGFDDHFADSGTYLCTACESPLYDSEMKFDCGCGWPGFWTNIKDAVAEREDKDGSGRTEIICSECGSHLGHLFRGERFKNPEPNERHCVNSVSLKFKGEDGKIMESTYNGPVH